MYAKPPARIANIAQHSPMVPATRPAFRFRKNVPNFGNKNQHTSPQAGYVVLYW
jgi:hypothetical protein